MERKNIPNKIIVHHSASPRDTTTISDIDRWHKARKFLRGRDGHYVGYHYVITGAGAVHPTKDEDEEGCHTIGHNLQSIGICLTGNFDIEIPSPAQAKALKKLLVHLLAKYDLGAYLIFPHKYFADTTCCGASLSAQRVLEVGDDAEKEILKINEEKRNMENRTFSIFRGINKNTAKEAILTPHTFGEGYVLFAPVTSKGRSEDESTFIRAENPDKDFATMTCKDWNILDIN